MIVSRQSVDITLSRGHLAICRDERDNRLKNGSQFRKNNYDEDKFSQSDADYIGALGELAVAHFTGYDEHFFEPYIPGRADVGMIEVRTRTLGKPPILRIYETDPHPITCLATIRTLTDDGAIVRLHGWCLTQIGWSYGKQVGKHWKKGVEYALAETFLRPMTTLVYEHKKMEAFYEFQSG